MNLMRSYLERELERLPDEAIKNVLEFVAFQQYLNNIPWDDGHMNPPDPQSIIPEIMEKIASGNTQLEPYHFKHLPPIDIVE